MQLKVLARSEGLQHRRDLWDQWSILKRKDIITLISCKSFREIRYIPNKSYLRKIILSYKIDLM